MVEALLDVACLGAGYGEVAEQIFLFVMSRQICVHGR